jgi:hypothetical protein
MTAPEFIEIEAARAWLACAFVTLVFAAALYRRRLKQGWLDAR